MMKSAFWSCLKAFLRHKSKNKLWIEMLWQHYAMSNNASSLLSFLPENPVTADAIFLKHPFRGRWILHFPCMLGILIHSIRHSFLIYCLFDLENMNPRLDAGIDCMLLTRFWKPEKQIPLNRSSFHLSLLLFRYFTWLEESNIIYEEKNP